MKKPYQLISVLFCLLMTIVFFLVGLYIAKITGAAKGQGLAGGAIVLFYGVISGVISLVISFFIVFHATKSRIILFTKFLLFLFIFLVAVTAYLANK